MQANVADEYGIGPLNTHKIDVIHVYNGWCSHKYIGWWVMHLADEGKVGVPIHIDLFLMQKYYRALYDVTYFVASFLGKLGLHLTYTMRQHSNTFIKQLDAVY